MISRTLFTLSLILQSLVLGNEFFQNYFDPLASKYRQFTEQQRLEALEETRQMFQFGYDCYMKCAFPLDELDPIQCKGRGPDKENPDNININDVLGDFSLTLVDTLDTLAILGNVTEFQNAVSLVVNHVSFDKLSTVQVFETTIRVIGGLLSAHLLIEEPSKPFGNLKPDWYTDELLTMAHDLADRLLAAFDTLSGLPHPRVNLVNGVPEDGSPETCTAGAGSLVLEMGLLSRILDDPVYEAYARRAVNSLWEIRDNSTGLFGFVMNVHSKQWISKFSGLGAGMDSFYEYLLKSHILFSEETDRVRFEEIYSNVLRFLRKGREKCNAGEGLHPIYINVDMSSGQTANNWIDALQAAFPGIQVLHGDIQEAICHHILYYAIWKRYGCLPERYDWKLDAPVVRFYPLRPEFMESTYLLYQATKNPFYLHVGRDVLDSLQNHTKTNCGYATIHDVFDKSLEDRQESFFLSETCKYLYLLFDVDNPVNINAEKYLFTTEGHVIPIKKRNKASAWAFENQTEDLVQAHPSMCDNPGPSTSFDLPLKRRYLAQIFDQFGITY